VRKEDKKLIGDGRAFLKSITYIAWPDDKTYQRFKAIALRFDDRVFEPDMVEGNAEKDDEIDLARAALEAERSGTPCGPDCVPGGWRSCMGCDDRIKKALKAGTI